MSRQEMLTHVVLHGGYHRGEIGRILAGLSISPPWDTFAVHLHRAEPERRLQTVREPLGA
ncbi:DinB family protein [Mesorhizobium sp. AR10]|uniref:DinB family protein n=1 Tax=Mesorhizobium sp. AR10 TaxID=2865839 RepID=UPI0029E7D98B|nr:DinB family protein [Mesorhizobium sp. AR10]